MASYDRFYDLVDFLKKNVHPFKLRRIKMPQGIDGDCFFDGKDFIIRIEKSLAEYYALDVLCHEVAHCGEGWGGEEDEHGPKWGKNFSFVYRKFLEWNDANNQ